MNDAAITDIPSAYAELIKKSREMGFTMPSDLYIGVLLKTLLTAKPGGNFLELGTGMSLSLSWMIDGMDRASTLITVDNDPNLTEISKEFFGKDKRLEIVCADGSEWLRAYKGKPFDLIFADAWPGKYSDLDETLSLLKVGGLYVIDDMNAQPNWPEGHQANVDKLVDYLESRQDLAICKMNWSTGVIIATRKPVE